MLLSPVAAGCPAACQTREHQEQGHSPAAVARVLAVLVAAARAGIVLLAAQAARAQRQRPLIQVHQSGCALSEALRQRLKGSFIQDSKNNRPVHGINTA